MTTTFGYREPEPAVEPGRFRALLKLFALGALVLLMLVPVSQLLGLVRERQSRQQQVREELAQLWGGQQALGALVLAIPYTSKPTQPGGEATLAGWTYFLPGAVQWHGSLEPQGRRRGLFEVTLYEARLEASGWFARPDPAALGVAPEQIDWAHAQVLLVVSDPRGLQERPVLRWAGRDRPFAPGLTLVDAFGSNLQAALAGGDLDDAGTASGGAARAGHIPFSLHLALRGSEALRLLPLGDDTTAAISSPWPHPSFVGAPLPREPAVAGKGFSASWSVPYFGRGFPQRWRGDQLAADRLRDELAAASFGVSLVRPADAYQQTERAVKYAVLFILLTFTTVFVLELLSPVRLHPMHYLLVGAALCLFYLLLLALAEHVGLTRAYAAATAATVALVTAYARAVLAGWGRALAIGGMLTVLYGWLYTVLRAEDYALLLGALGLFATLAAVMFLTRRLDWTTLRFRQPALG